MVRRFAFVLFVSAVLASDALAQGGYTKEKRPELGFTFSRARDYEAVPISPREEWVVLYYAEEEAFRERDRKRFRPELRFVWIDNHPEPVPVDAVAVASHDDEDDDDDGEEVEPPKPIDGFDDYVEQKIRGFDLGEARPFVERYDNVGHEYELLPKNRQSEIVGHAFTFDDGDRTLAIFGICAVEDLEDQVRIWRKMLDRAKFYEPVPIDNSKLERMYSRKRYTRPDYRIKVRNQLVDGWDAEDTENYIVVYSTKDRPLLRTITRELEAIREEYVKLFPPAIVVDAVSTVRVCENEPEYRKYGGPPRTGGYWSQRTEELVFFDYENVDGIMGSGTANTRLVLYHEAFHQYIYYAIGEIAPHSWFNEGMGDYFGGAVIKGGKVKKIGVNPWRIELIQASLNGHPRYRPEPLQKLLRYSQAEFYDRRRISVCYAQAWSFIYFLETSRDVRKHPVWSTLLDVYFDTLKNEYAKLLWGKNELDLEDEEKSELQQKARDVAVEKAFSDVDLRELELAWKEYTLDLKVPR